MLSSNIFLEIYLLAKGECFFTSTDSASINEYFTTGFVEYFMGDKAYLNKISPKLYEVMYNLEENENEL